MRATVVDALSGREIVAGDEEQEATQPLVFHLVQRLGWNPKQIISRPQWRVPRIPSGARKDGYPVDLAIFDAPEHQGDPDHIRIVVECKAPDEATGITQLKTYLSLEPEARLGIWFNGRDHVLVWKLRSGFEMSSVAPIPRPQDPLAPTSAGRKPLHHGDLVPPPHLGRVFSQLRDKIAAMDTHVNRDEFILNDLANLLICKIADEQAGEADPDRTLAFQRAATRAATATAIRHFFNDTRNRLRSVFVDDSDMIHVDDASLERIVEALEPYQLLGNDRHVVGEAFQILRGKALKGTEGAYFTPPPLVDCVVSLVDPTHEERVIDPACGTGGFLAAALDHVFGAVEARPKITQRAKDTAKRRWAQELLLAIDKDAVSVKLCKAYLTLLGDGRSHVYRANTIDRREWSGRTDDLTRTVKAGTFDIVMTNPPFGKNLVVPAEVGRAENLTTCRKWKRVGGAWEPTADVDEQQLGIVFLERAVELLKPNGRIAIVLPETFLFSSRLAWFVDWICRSLTVTHVVDVPMVAFEEFCRAKTCILIALKVPPLAGHKIAMSYPKSIGLDHYQKPLYRRDARGQLTGELDNEMAEAVRQFAASAYKGARAPDANVLASGIVKQATVAPKGDGRLRFHVKQSDARGRGVLVPRYWWRRDTDAELQAWAKKHDAEIVTFGELHREGALKMFGGHGSPPGNARRTGTVPYVKVTDLKNWRINENPTNFIHDEVAAALRKRGPMLAYGDLVSPARASANIGQFCMVMPWQTGIVLTKEVVILRAERNERGLDPFLLLALLSLRVVQAQYEALALMQTNREHLGDRWKEVRIPVPSTPRARGAVSGPIQSYFDAQVAAHDSYDGLFSAIPREDFGNRP